MLDLASQYPIFGPEIRCPHCHQKISALTLTDAYLCNAHGIFEVKPDGQDLVHLPSGRCWRLWEDKWYHQHTHPDALRFEIHEALDHLYTQGYRAIKIIVAQRYRSLLMPYFQRAMGVLPSATVPRLYGLPVGFSPDPHSDPQGNLQGDPRWNVINFDLETSRESLQSQMSLSYSSR
jgi:uncharacterized protein (TIGR02652 family)